VVPCMAAEGYVNRCGWHGMQGVRGSNPLSSTRHNAGRRWRITRLPMEHVQVRVRVTPSTTWMRADHQPAQLIQTGRLHLAMTS
jgi:hypothetical protein